MRNNDALKFYKNMSKGSSLNSNSVKLAKNSDFSQMDAEFIMKYANCNSKILDLGSGTGLIINKLFDKVDHITAVEPFKEFTNFINNTPKIEIINEDIFGFQTNKKFDLITMFALVQYFNKKEITDIYKKYKINLKKGGTLIIKGQFGVDDDVTISGFSEELKSNYYSQYRHIKKEVKILESIGYKNIEVIDIYPPECSRWNNTHFFAIVAQN